MENNNTPGQEPTLKQLQQQVESLRHVIVSFLVLSIVVSGTFTLYLLRQAKYARTEAATYQAEINQYANTNLPMIKKFGDLLTEYSKTHPEFAPIARKYGLGASPAAPAPVGTAPTGTAPTAVPKQKK